MTVPLTMIGKNFLDISSRATALQLLLLHFSFTFYANAFFKFAFLTFANLHFLTFCANALFKIAFPFCANAP